MDTDTTQQESFNLVTEPWIQVETLQGDTETVSLEQVFRSASQIRRVSGDTPAQDMAIFRLLLVIFWRANRHNELLDSLYAEDKAEWWKEHYLQDEPESLSTPVQDYLDEFRDRFNLFDSKRPFMQVADLTTGKDFVTTGIGKLVPDAEDEYFTMRAGESLDSVSAAEAARWLIALHAWNYAGIKTGVIGDDRVKRGKSYSIGAGWSGVSGGIIIHGDSLAQSFILNTDVTTVFGENMDADVPVWERDTPDTAGTHGREIPFGPCELLTWQSRRVRLYHSAGRVFGLLITNGDRLNIENLFLDPMTGYRYSKNKSKKGSPVRYPKPHNSSRTLWRGIEALLIRTGSLDDASDTSDLQPRTVSWLREVSDLLRQDERKTVGIELIGTVYGTQDSVVRGSVHEELPMRLATLADQNVESAQALMTAAEITMQAALQLGRLAGNLQEAAGGDYEFDPHVMESFLNSLNGPFKQWTEGFTLSMDPIEYRKKWFTAVRRLIIPQGQILIRGAGPQALIGTENQDGQLVSAATAWSTFSYHTTKLLEPERFESSAHASV